MNNASALGWTLLLAALSIGLYLFASMAMFASTLILPIFSTLAAITQTQNVSTNPSSTSWCLPNRTDVNNLNVVVDGKGVYGFDFNKSYTLAGNDYYRGYDWCNMPHVNTKTYIKASEDYTLEYIEVIHRHHKRTPYAANTFPRESYPWDCNDEGLFYYGKPLNPTSNNSTSVYWSIYSSPSNPFAAGGFNGTCQFPQITRGGLDDSWQHGKDLYTVYHDTLGFIPDSPGDKAVYRVTNNVITSQVIAMVVNGMYTLTTDVPLKVESATIDSLEPTYTCPTATSLYSDYSIGGTNPNWTTHLIASAPLFTFLDSLSGIDPTDADWHQSWDHYFDNLSSRLCHAKALPCQLSDPTNCVNETIADKVFRLGHYEYSYIYRDAPQSLEASTASFGVWVAELAQNIRDAISGEGGVLYRHNVAHDGSLAKLLSILQVDVMVWPGMGSEVVFEIYKRAASEDRFVRILWGGVVLRSSNPVLGLVDLIPVDRLLEYFDGLVGVRAVKVPGLCGVL